MLKEDGAVQLMQVVLELDLLLEVVLQSQEANLCTLLEEVVVHL
jgi:hypothetical protein